MHQKTAVAFSGNRPGDAKNGQRKHVAKKTAINRNSSFKNFLVAKYLGYIPTLSCYFRRHGNWAKVRNY